MKMPSSLDDRKGNQHQSTAWDKGAEGSSATPPSHEASQSVDSLFGRSLGHVIRPITSVVAPTTVLVALLVYFGWVYGRAYYSAFGISPSILGFSNQDYVLSSITVVFLTLRGVLLAALFMLWAHFLIRRLMKNQRLEKHPWISSSLEWVFVLLGLGVALSLGSGIVVGGLTIAELRLIQPLAFTLGFALVGYGFYLSELHATESKSSRRQPRENMDISKWRQWSLAVVIGLVMYGLFWLSANYALVLGRYAVDNFAAQVKYLPRVSVYSQESLSLEAGGVILEQVNVDPKTYRYTGLRFLARSGSKYFLLPEAWTPSDGATIILPESDTIRIEVAAGEIPP
jgi:hypothetical protein